MNKLLESLVFHMDYGNDFKELGINFIEQGNEVFKRNLYSFIRGAFYGAIVGMGWGCSNALLTGGSPLEESVKNSAGMFATIGFFADPIVYMLRYEHHEHGWDITKWDF